MSPLAAGPLLYLDVDGPLIPFGSGPYASYPPGVRGPGAHPLLTRVDPALGRRLAALPCVLVWATTWMEEANASLAPRLGLPRLPVLDWPEPVGAEPPGAVHWKTPAILGHAAGRPFVWVDDEITGADRAWVAARHPGRALLHRVDPGRGLTEADFTALRAWLVAG